MVIQPQLNYILIFYSQVKAHLISDTYTTPTQLYNDFYSKGDTDTLLADTVSNTGNVSLPGQLDSGTTYVHKFKNPMQC